MNLDNPSPRRTRRPGKEWRERILAAVLLLPAAPVLVACSIAIKVEGLIDRSARGPIFFKEDRISRGEVFKLLKFRTLDRRTLESLGEGPTHIKDLENSSTTRVGHVLKQWYLDELPQLINIVRGDMFLIGSRPWPIELYEAHLQAGMTLKRDMPAGLIGPVQAAKGSVDPRGESGEGLDEWYWELFQTAPWWKLLWIDVKIIARSIRTQLQHKGL